VKNSKQARIILDTDAHMELASILSVLKAEKEFVKITPSKLVSWIIKTYAKKYFARDKKQIVKDHFNSKEYLKHVTKGLNPDDDLESVLKLALDKVRQNTVKPTRKKHIDGAASQEQG